ncbi:hypothetical protein ACI65C_006939 [Semiaphis heraclei]
MPKLDYAGNLLLFLSFTFRFPLSNPVTLPMWIAVTGREKERKPCKSSRLCNNHFENSEYIIGPWAMGHGKNVLKETSVPTIDYRVDAMVYQKKKILNSSNDVEQTNTFLTDKPVDTSDTNLEIVQLQYNNMYNSKDEHQNNHLLVSNLENSNDNGDGANEETVENEYEDYNYDLKNDICNRDNQCYMFTSSFKKGAEPIVLTPPEEKPPEESLNMTIDQTTADLNFRKVMALTIKKQRRTKDVYSLYFKTLKKKSSQEQEKDNNEEAHSFAMFIEAQLKDLCPHRKVYLSAQHKIKKILMKAQLKIAN